MRFVIRNLCFLTIPLPLFVSAAEYPEVSVGFKGGYQWALDDAYDNSEPSGSMLGVYSGLQFTPNWSWDVGYQNHEALKADVTSVHVETWLIDSALRYDWFIRNNLSFYGRLGAAYWNMEKTQVSSNKVEANGFSPLGEVGINYDFTHNSNFSVGYQYINSVGKSDTGKYDSHGIMVGFTYTFGKDSEVEPLTEQVSSEPVNEIVVEPEPSIYVFPSQQSEIKFANNSMEIRAEFIEPLSELVSILKRYPQSQLSIVGHSDSTGTTAYNQTLSEKRAEIVANKVIELGAPSTQVDWYGEGELNPTADNNTVEGRDANRRVEINLSQFEYEK